ncbi:hypothetical protein HOC01_02865 [archaeon]|nr:hypothetical protein [archaeon]MBT6698168.1 hypothetical protein [archaeon]
MKRKIIRQGIGGHTIFLPIKWVRERGLKPGDEIEIDETGPSLLISTGSAAVKEAKISFSSESETFIRIKLHDLYRLGYTKIKISYKTKKQSKIIHEVCSKYLLGSEVTLDTGSEIILEDLVGLDLDKHHTLMRRIFYIMRECFEITQDGLSNPDEFLLNQIKIHSQKIDQYDNFCRRSISQKRFTDERTHFYWTFFVYLRLIQHNMLHFGNFIVKNDFKIINKKIGESFEILKNLFLDLEKGFFKEDIKIIEKVHNSANRLLYEKLLLEFKNVPKEQGALIYYISELARTIYLSTSPAIGILAARNN